MLINHWILSAPIMVYVFFAGALADKYGKKPVIVTTMFGEYMNTNHKTIIFGSYISR